MLTVCLYQGSKNTPITDALGELVVLCMPYIIVITTIAQKKTFVALVEYKTAIMQSIDLVLTREK